MSGRGLFVSFEGGEGSGKTTQSELLALRLQAGGWPALRLREPGGTPLGEQVRQLLLHREKEMTPEAELLLFRAARVELVRKVIAPTLEAGGVVICDRFSDSTLAYQGYGRGLDVDAVRYLDSWVTAGLTPDLTVLLDVPLSVGRGRQRDPADAIESEDDAFHERVRQGYLALARKEPERWLVLNGQEDPEALANIVAGAVQAKAAPST